MNPLLATLAGPTAWKAAGNLVQQAARPFAEVFAGARETLAAAGDGGTPVGGVQTGGLDPVAMRSRIAELQGEVERRLDEIFTRLGMSPEEGVTLSVSVEDGRIEVQGAGQAATALEAALNEDAEWVAQFRELFNLRGELGTHLNGSMLPAGTIDTTSTRLAADVESTGFWGEPRLQWRSLPMP